MLILVVESIIIHQHSAYALNSLWVNESSNAQKFGLELWQLLIDRLTCDRFVFSNFQALEPRVPCERKGGPETRPGRPRLMRKSQASRYRKLCWQKILRNEWRCLWNLGHFWPGSGSSRFGFTVQVVRIEALRIAHWIQHDCTPGMELLYPKPAKYTPGSTNIAIAGKWGPRIEDVFPIKNDDFPLLC